MWVFIVSFALSVFSAVCQAPLPSVSGCVWTPVDNYQISTYAGGDGTIFSTLDAAAARCKALGRPICFGVQHSIGGSDFSMRGSNSGVPAPGQRSYWMDCPAADACRWTNTQPDVSIAVYANGDGTVYPTLGAASEKCAQLGPSCTGVTHSTGGSDFTCRGSTTTASAPGQESFWKSCDSGCYATYSNSYLSGVAGTGTTYNNLGAAEAACDQLGTTCSGVVGQGGLFTLRSLWGLHPSPSGETAYAKCGCYNVYPNYFVSGAAGTNGASYTDLGQAKFQCDFLNSQAGRCTAIVRDNTGSYTLRSGTVVAPSPSHEIAYTKCELQFTIQSGLVQAAQNVLSP